jgi:membrane glycosyltransferase
MDLYADLRTHDAASALPRRAGRRHANPRQRAARAPGRHAGESRRSKTAAARADRWRCAFDATAWHARLRTQLAGADGLPLVQDRRGRVRLRTTPPLLRSPMAPRAWLGQDYRQWSRDRRIAEGPDRHGAWGRVALCRRLALATLVIGQTWLATNLMVQVLPYHGRPALELAVLLLFAVLFGWISAGFWTALAGFLTLALRRDRHAITRTIPAHASARDIPPDARTAIVMPICNEDVPARDVRVARFRRRA